MKKNEKIKKVMDIIGICCNAATVICTIFVIVLKIKKWKLNQNKNIKD